MGLLRNIIAVLVGMGLAVQASAANDETKVRTYYNQVSDSFRYVIGYKQDADIYEGKKTGWVFQVSEAQGEELPKYVRTENMKSQAEVTTAMARTGEELLKQGFMDVDSLSHAGSSFDLGSYGYRNSAKATEGNNPIWRVTNQWNWQWELAYSKWVSSLDQFFFYKNKIPTDCADVVISLRWIFARNNGLPAANTLTANGQMVGHMTESKSWSHLPTAADWRQDQRFLKALEYVREATYTGSLRNDSYPIAITKDSLIPGVHHLELNPQGGHAFIVSKVEIARPVKIEYMESTLPVEIRRLRVKDYAYSAQPPVRLGFLRNLWVVKNGGTWSYLDPESHPGFSDEQYQPEFMGAQAVFAAAVSNHLRGANNNEFNFRSFKTMIELIRQKIKLRVLTIAEAQIACRTIDCRPGTDGFDEYSTPVADSKLKTDIKTALAGLEAQKNNRDVQYEWNKFRNLDLDLKYNNMVIKMGDAIDLLMAGKTNSDPRSSVLVRWGL